MNEPCANKLSVDGKRCPELEHAPTTAAGHAVAAALNRIGTWDRNPMSGQVTGMKLHEAMASLPREVDSEFARRLLLIAEPAFVLASLENTKSETNDAYGP